MTVLPGRPGIAGAFGAVLVVATPFAVLMIGGLVPHLPVLVPASMFFALGH